MGDRKIKPRDFEHSHSKIGGWVGERVFLMQVVVIFSSGLLSLFVTFLLFFNSSSNHVRDCSSA